jgi:hypothetical protein
MLQPGDIVEIENVPHRVVRVNECRAVCQPLTPRQVRIRTIMGRVVSFAARGGLKSISPNSDLSHAGLREVEKILARLQESPGEWVAMPELYRVSGAFAVHSRISDLRKRGHVIEQWNEWEDLGGRRAEGGGRICKSSYRLVGGGEIANDPIIQIPNCQ